MAVIMVQDQQQLPHDVVHVDVCTRYPMSAGTLRVNGSAVPQVRSASRPSGRKDLPWLTQFHVDLTGASTGPAEFAVTVTTRGTSVLTSTAHIGATVEPEPEPDPEPIDPRPRLDWAPPALEDPIDLYATDAAPKFADLSPTQDYRIHLPGAVGHPQQTPLQADGGLVVSGGRHVVIIGGAIRHDIDYAAGTNRPRGVVNRAVFLKNWTGTAFVEGVDIAGDLLFEGINVENTNPDARLYVQSCRVPDPVLALVGGGHEGGDVLQAWAGPQGGLFVSRLTARTTYQGIFMQPWHFDWGRAYAPRTVVLSKVQIAHWTAEERAVRQAAGVPDQGPTPKYRTWASYAILAQLGKLGEPGADVGRYVLDDVWLDKATDQPFPGAGLSHAVEPKAKAGMYGFAGGTDEQGRRHVEWDTLETPDRIIEGRVFEGAPTEAFCGPTQAGIGYTSPGYLDLPVPA